MGGQARRGSLGEVRGGIRGCVRAKDLQDGLDLSLDFNVVVARFEIGNEGGRRRARSK